jgi:small Trp-rich protein
MPLLAIGVLLLLGKMAEIGPVGEWSWWIILTPFGLAVAWWQFSDSTGLTQRKAIDKMERRKVERRDRALESLGLDHRREKQVARAREDAAARRTSADPTQADASASEDQAPRRDAR